MKVVFVERGVVGVTLYVEKATVFLIVIVVIVVVVIVVITVVIVMVVREGLVDDMTVTIVVVVVVIGVTDGSTLVTNFHTGLVERSVVAVTFGIRRVVVVVDVTVGRRGGRRGGTTLVETGTDESEGEESNDGNQEQVGDELVGKHGKDFFRIG